MRAEARAAELEARLQAQPQPAPAKSAEIRRSDFASDDEFHRALLDDHINRRVREEVGKTREEFSKRDEARSAEQALGAFHREAEKQAEAAGIDFADDWQTLTELPKVSRAVAEYLFEAADNKAALVHHLAEHPEEVDRISELHPARASRELARLDLQLGEKPKPNVTKAPPPGPTVGGRAVHHGDWRASNDMDEFASGFMKAEEERRKMG